MTVVDRMPDVRIQYSKPAYMTFLRIVSILQEQRNDLRAWNSMGFNGSGVSASQDVAISEGHVRHVISHCVLFLTVDKKIPLEDIQLLQGEMRAEYTDI